MDDCSSTHSLLDGVHVPSASIRERYEHQCKTFGDNDRTAHSDGHRGNHTGSACPCSDCRTDQSSGDNSTGRAARNGSSTNHHPQEPTATAALIATAAPIPPSLPESQTEPLLLLTTTPTIVLRVTVSAVPSALPDYDRNDWKHCADRDCQDARNEVLIAESRTSVAYRSDRKCRVAAGEWLAPYTNTIVTDPGRLDVDHMVPLGNAHDSGAWQWSANQRERYANYLEDPQHLIAVTAGANRSKGARGPDQWKPEDRTYWCQYATDWITIKSTWELTVTQQEHTALVQMLNTCAKRPELMVSSESQVKPTPGPTSNPLQQTPTPEMRTYNSCDAAQAAGATRIQGSKGNGRGFPKWMVPSARDGDGDGVVCER